MPASIPFQNLLLQLIFSLAETGEHAKPGEAIKPIFLINLLM
jgi:hypothetical protein